MPQDELHLIGRSLPILGLSDFGSPESRSMASERFVADDVIEVPDHARARPRGW
jgi:hypothetical protein